jgi:hypothetical protein
MRYFRMSPLQDERCADIHDPVDSAGRSVYSGQPLECEGPLTAELVFPEPALLLDYMSTMTGQLLVRRRAATFIQELRLQEGWQALPCAVVSERRAVLRECVCFHFPNWVDVLDKERSEFKPMPHGERGPVTRPVLKRSLVRQYDICKEAYVRFVCSETLVRTVEKHNLEGFVFQELECVD